MFNKEFNRLWAGGACLHQAQDKIERRHAVNTVMNLQALQKEKLSVIPDH
jgi:hypothetical protein